MKGSWQSHGKSHTLPCTLVLVAFLVTKLILTYPPLYFINARLRVTESLPVDTQACQVRLVVYVCPSCPVTYSASDRGHPVYHYGGLSHCNSL